LAGNRSRQGGGETARAKSDGFADNMYFADADFDVVDAVKKAAQDAGATPAQIALAWLLHKDGVTAPIIGATKMEHLDQAIEAVDIELSEGDMERLEAPYVPHQVMGHS
jgi:aryl-alcohol dehydrogenase (NADP+)